MFDLETHSEEKTRLQSFAKEYAELCHKYNLQICACGCCDSPYLQEIAVTKLSELDLHDICYVTADKIVHMVDNFVQAKNL